MGNYRLFAYDAVVVGAKAKKSGRKLLGSFLVCASENKAVSTFNPFLCSM